MYKAIFLVAWLLALCNPFVLAADDDGDGIDSAVEITNGTDPNDADTDDDLLLDGQEDLNQNGVVDAGESNPLDADTDDDGLSDGEEAAYALNKLVADYDGDGLNDGLELGRSVGIPAGISSGGIAYAGTSATWGKDYDPSTRTDPRDNDTDGDGLSDGEEDRDRDGLVDGTETNPLDADTDDDGLKDGEEDVDRDGILDATETDPKDSDSDNDNLNDGLERGRASAIPGGTSEGGVTMVVFSGTAAGWVPDSNPATVTDAKAKDTDNDGLQDGTEDADLDGNLDAGESNPTDADSDDDGIKDGEEGTFTLDLLKADTDNDGLSDGLEIGRTTGIPGGTSNYYNIPYLGTAFAWMADADPATKTDPRDQDTDNDGIADGDEDRDRDGLVDGAETNPLDADTDDDGLKDGEEDVDRDGILDATETDPKDSDSDDDNLNDGLERGKSSPVAGGTSEGPSVLTRVVFYGTAAGWVPDSNPSTVTDAKAKDTDNDGLQDGTEDADLDGNLDAGESNPTDADTDDDGLKDGEEGTFELDLLKADTDNDGLSDGLELGKTTRISAGTSNYNSIPFLGTDISWMADADPATKTDPRDQDTDNDGLSDGEEDRDRDGLVDGAETNPLDADTDNDGLLDGDEDVDKDGILDATETDPKKGDTDNDLLTDGLELGMNVGIPGGTSDGGVTSVSYSGSAPLSMHDINPATRTDPRDLDTDDDGLADGFEDADQDGDLDAGESDPLDADTDDDGISDGEEGIYALDPLKADTDNDGLNDGLEIGRITGIPDGSSSLGFLFLGTDFFWVADADPATTTDPLSGDTDQDGLADGSEDTDLDGLVDATETDPNDPDTDSDGSQDNEDCASLDPSIHPGAQEIIADGIDQDCDGGDLCYLDADDDGYRPDATSTVTSVDCDCDDPYEATGSDPIGDCNDYDAQYHPGAAESCDDPDYNCDGISHESSFSDIEVAACGSYTAPDEQIYTASGIYTAVISNAAGCDSIITIDLTVNRSTTSSISETACGSYEWNGTVYTETGDYTFTTLNAAGCDSVATLHLTINPTPGVPVITQTGNILHSDAPEGNQWYDQNGLISGATAQDHAGTTGSSYYTIVTLLNCSSAHSNTIQVTSTGIGQTDRNFGISAYPNPFGDAITLEAAGYPGRLEVDIFSLSGQKVYNGYLIELTVIETAGFLPGEYLIRIGDGSTYSLVKMIKP